MRNELDTVAEGVAWRPLELFDRLDDADKWPGSIGRQTMSIERVRRSNQSNAIEHDRMVEIRLSNAIESQSNGQILGNYSIGSIEIRLRSIEILLAFDCVLFSRFDHV